jgi:erythromycin esterase
MNKLPMKPLLWNILIVFLFFGCKQQEDAAQFDDELENSTIPAMAIEGLESPEDLDRLLDEIGEAQYVLLGEASHGTSEYYTWRAEITKRLVQEKGFTIVGVEGDWPDLYRFNQYVQGSNVAGASAQQVLQQLDRWPTWMWANQEVAQLGEWLRTHNESQEESTKVGFYGIDVYSLWPSMEAVLAYLEMEDPASAQAARDALACFAAYEGDEWAYAEAAYSEQNSCADELEEMLALLEQKAAEAPVVDEALSNALQNARVAVNAERYFTTATTSSSASWNVRDRHMMQTINDIVAHRGENAKIIVWEHNTHIGDARATDMASAGMVNVGQLVREQHSQSGVYIVGFGSYSGTVLAASQWEGQMETMQVPAGRKGSWEAMLHSIEPLNKIVFMDELRDISLFKQPIGHRAIGVVYDPGSEQGNYVPSVMPERYDAFIFIDETSALHPLSGAEGERKGSAMLQEAGY